MKLMTLNIWGGHVRDPLLEFIKAQQDIDIFCLQEVYHHATNKISTEDRAVSLNIFSELHQLLPQHKAFFRPVVDSIYGIGILVKNSLDILGEGEIIIHHNPSYLGSGPTHSRNLQWLKCCHGKQHYAILNVHGLWNGMGKTDTLERIAQSQKIKLFIDHLNLPTVLCGDFNLRPDTESIKIIEEGMNNLIKLYNINSTRTELYIKEEKFADYIFTSTDITVHSFSVLSDVVSDHAPLVLDFV